MKAIKSHLLITGILMVLFSVILSCPTAEIAAISGPEFSGNKISKVAAVNKMSGHKTNTVSAITK